MIQIDDKLISSALVEEQFICNLNKCKGVCCVLGDGGAPLEEEELGIMDDIFDEVAPYLTPEGLEAIEKQGRYIAAKSKYGPEFSTPLVNGQACAYVRYDANGITECAIHRAYLDGETDWIKPISCHLYPIRITAYPHYDAVNYEHWDICKAACELGKQEGVAVYEFLKEPLIRKYGKDFYEQLDAAAKHIRQKDGA